MYPDRGAHRSGGSGSILTVLSEVPFPAWSLRNAPKPSGKSPLEQGIWTHFSVARQPSRHPVAGGYAAGVAPAQNPVQ